MAAPGKDDGQTGVLIKSNKLTLGLKGERKSVKI